MRRSRRGASLAIALALLATATAGCTKVAAPPPERIVLIVVDTLRRDHVSPYGSAVPTPNIQRLADEGQVFTNAVASFHQTTMSMAALFTGRTPSIESGDAAHSLPWNGRNWCGLARFAAEPEDSCVPQGLTTVAEDLQGAGYRTIGVVSNRFLFRPAGYDQGFDEWIEVAASDPDQLLPLRVRARSGQQVQAAVDRVLDRLLEGPFFLYVHYMEAHDYGATGGSYAAAVGRVDEHVGRLRRSLEARGLFDGAVVFFTSDHGELLTERYAGFRTKTHKGNPSFQPVLEVPLIVAPPRFGDRDALVRGQDVGNLIREVAGLPPGPGAELAVARDELFLSEMNYLTYRRGRYKSVVHRRHPVQRGLFDLEADPEERRNLIRSEPEIGREHGARLGELVEVLAAEGSDAQPSDEDVARLRSLGYLEE